MLLRRSLLEAAMAAAVRQRLRPGTSHSHHPPRHLSEKVRARLGAGGSLARTVGTPRRRGTDLGMLSATGSRSDQLMDPTDHHDEPLTIRGAVRAVVR